MRRRKRWDDRWRRKTPAAQATWLLPPMEGLAALDGFGLLGENAHHHEGVRLAGLF